MTKRDHSLDDVKVTIAGIHVGPPIPREVHTFSVGDWARRCCVDGCDVTDCSASLHVGEKSAPICAGHAEQLKRQKT